MSDDKRIDIISHFNNNINLEHVTPNQLPTTATQTEIDIENNRVTALNDAVDHLKNSFNIETFKTKFNTLLDYLYTKGMHLDDVLQHYALYGNLSKTILHLLYIAHHIDGRRTTPWTGWNSNDKHRFANWLWNKYRKNKNVLLPYPPHTTGAPLNYNKLEYNKLHAAGCFDLYNDLIKLETFNFGYDYKDRTTILAININKYFFLTEILLKLLLDTNYNNDVATNREIQRNYNTYSVENGFDTPHFYWTGQTNDTMCTKTGYVPSNIQWWLKYKLLKQIIQILQNINKNVKEIENKQVKFDQLQRDLAISSETIDKLSRDSTNYNRKNTTLEEKQNELEIKQNKQKRNMIILFVIAMLLLIANILSKQSGKLFQVNVAIIVIIFIIKFYYILK